MTLGQLTYFITLAETLHYTKAAQKLYVSQPSLSRAVSELEKELDAPLFAKDGKNTILTKYGEAFLPFARGAINQIEEGQKTIEMMLRPSPVVRLGYIYSLSFSMLPKILEDYMAIEGNHDAKFTFFQGMNRAIVEKLKRGELDMAIALRPYPEDDEIESTFAFRQELYLVVPRGHHLASKDRVTLEDLEHESFVTISSQSNLRRQIDNIFETLNTTPRTTFEAEECNSMASFVSANLGVAIMPEIPALYSYNVEVIPVEGNLLTRKIYILHVKNRALSPGSQRFFDYLMGLNHDD